jgi:hypothetical protein
MTDRHTHALATLAELSASPEYDNPGWRLGVSDWMMEEVLERMEPSMSMTPTEVREQNMVNYIRENWKPEDRVAIVLIDRSHNNFVTQKIKIVEQIAAAGEEPLAAEAKQFRSHLRAANANGSDVYISMSSLKPEATGRTKADIETVRHIYLDIDEGGREAIDKILATHGMPQAHHVIESSPGKHQIIWSVSGFSVPQAESLMRGMAAQHGADPAATDAARILRLPGLRNQKYSEFHFVREVQTQLSNRREYTPADFPAVSQSERQAVQRTVGVSKNEVDQSKVDATWTLAQLRKGIDPGTVRAELAAFRASRHDKANPQDYAERTVRWALTEISRNPNQMARVRSTGQGYGQSIGI